MYNLRLIFALCLFFGISLDVEARLNGGGFLEPIDPNNPEVISFAKWAAKELNGTFITVASAHKQVVAGWMFHITMRMESKEQKEEICRVKVWVRQWLNSVKLVGAMCTPLSERTHNSALKYRKNRTNL